MGFGGTGGGLPGLLPLDSKHPDLQNIFRSGDVEDDFDIEKEPIARGKFASVRLACHRITKEIYAAKFIRRRRRASNLEEEARHEVAVLLLGRSDPHIVHLHQVYETRTEYIIILEFGAGGDLQRLLDERGRFQEKVVKELLLQILSGLQFLHQQRIAHLDIKPQNLVLMGTSTDEGLKLVDFGLSRVIQQDTELTQIMGTPDYVAPEVINFEAVGLSTDMWSIGVLTYVFLTGYTPFGGDTDQETFVNITQGDFDFPEEYFTDVTELAKDFISSLLIKTPSQRMTVEQCVSHPWLCDVFDPRRLLQLEADSDYLTDHCNGSPPSPDSLSSGYVSDLYQCSIPEESPLSCSEQQYQQVPSLRNFDRLQIPKLGRDNDMNRCLNNDEKRTRVSSAHLSINVLEAFQQGQRPQSKPLRRSSLVIPRYEHDKQVFEETADYNANKTFNSLYSPDYYGHTTSAQNLSWGNNTQMGHIGNSPLNNQFDQNALLNLTRPWKNLCNGSYTRALNQLNNKTSPKIKNSRTNLGCHPELSCSMFELKPSYDISAAQQHLLKTSKSEIRKSKGDLRSSKSDLRGSKETRGSIQELRGSKQDLRGSKLDLSCKADLRGSKIDLSGKGDLRCSKAEIRASRSDLRGSKADIRGSRSDLRGSKLDLRGSKSDLRVSKPEFNQVKNDLRLSKQNNNILSSLNARTIAHLNMSLSRLDLAQESLDNEEAEERDVVYSDCTLPRRFSRPNASSLLHGNTFHMSFRKSKKKDDKL